MRSLIGATLLGGAILLWPTIFFLGKPSFPNAWGYLPPDLVWRLPYLPSATWAAMLCLLPQTFGAGRFALLAKEVTMSLLLAPVPSIGVYVVMMFDAYDVHALIGNVVPNALFQYGFILIFMLPAVPFLFLAWTLHRRVASSLKY